MAERPLAYSGCVRSVKSIEPSSPWGMRGSLPHERDFEQKPRTMGGPCLGRGGGGGRRDGTGPWGH